MSDNKTNISGTWQRLSFALLAAVAAFFLWTEHRAHLLGILPYLVLLLCPLMHFFMHRGHGDGHGRDRNSGGDHNH
ncbi:MAG: hypothetical protein Kow0089_07300 [Desulfobulbaceae bacterium]